MVTSRTSAHTICCDELADDFEFHAPGRGIHRTTGGREPCRTVLRANLVAMPDRRLRVIALAASGDKVCHDAAIVTGRGSAMASRRTAPVASGRPPDKRESVGEGEEGRSTLFLRGDTCCPRSAMAVHFRGPLRDPYSKAVAIVLLGIPALVLMALAIGEMASGEASGIQHVPEALLLLVVAGAAWRYPRMVGNIVLVGGGILFLAWIVWVATVRGSDALPGAVLFLAPLISGWLLRHASDGRSP